MQMLITSISLVLDLHDDTSCMSDGGLHRNDIAVIVNVSEESVASEVHNTGVNDHVYVVEDTPCVPEHNYRRLLTSPVDVSTPQLRREDPNPIPTNLRSLSQFARQPLLIPCLYQRATWLTKMELEAADVTTPQFSSTWTLQPS